MPLIAESSLLRSMTTHPGRPAVPGEAAAPAASGPAPAAADGTPAPYLSQLMPLEEILRRRRSVRRFAEEPVQVHELESVIRHGLAAERSCWPPGAHPAVGLRIAIAAFAVRGLEAGLYLAEPDTGTCTAPPLEDGSLAGLPARYCEAPVMIFVCGSLAQACAAYGQRGYPRLLVRAGAAGYGAWLAAVAAGLAGCAYGATSHRVTAAVSRHSGGSLRHLFTVAIGRPVAGDADDH